MQTSDPDYKLTSINRKKLDQYIKAELEDQGIYLNHDYAVFSNSQDQYIIRNGVFAVPLEGDAKFTPIMKCGILQEITITVWTIRHTKSSFLMKVIHLDF